MKFVKSFCFHIQNIKAIWKSFWKPFTMTIEIKKIKTFRQKNEFKWTKWTKPELVEHLDFDFVNNNSNICINNFLENGN